MALVDDSATRFISGPSIFLPTQPERTPMAVSLTFELETLLHGCISFQGTGKQMVVSLLVSFYFVKKHKKEGGTPEKKGINSCPPTILEVPHLN